MPSTTGFTRVAAALSMQLDWLKVEGKKRQVEMDEQALELSKRLLARHQEEAADDAGPLK